MAADAILRLNAALSGRYRVERPLGEPEQLFQTVRYIANSNHTSYGILPDGQTFLFISQGDPTIVVVVLNWLEELKEKLGN